MEKTKTGLINFLINLADYAPDITFGKVKRFEYYGNDSYLVEFASGYFVAHTFLGEIHIEKSYDSARRFVPPQIIPIHYPGDIPD
jgi:hypothetical protein